MKSLKKLALLLTLIFALTALAACGSEGGDTEDTGSDEGKTEENGKEAAEGEELSGDVKVAGSSTVFPMQVYLAEKYQAEQPNVSVTVDSIGSGGGFKKSTKGEIDLSNASRPIKDEEKAIAEENGIQLEPLTLAYDGLTVAVSAENDFVDSLTVEQLKEIFLADSGKTKWSDINEEWPEETIKIYSPGHDSGTFDYFNEVILEENPMREDEDVTLSEDDNVLVRGIQNDPNAIGFFGYAYYFENKDSLKALAIAEDGGEPVEPNNDTIQSGDYSPLSRPLFTYANVNAIKEKAQVYDYTKFVLENAGAAAEEVKYVALPDDKYQEQLDQLNEWAGK
ncbi:PstS family phosphate ABC transporter substrate-binding protein [Pontibacillus litoralis]|uniref:Phosphate-binding protein n=1 Tax=Pontibacillus litoralis JSM 072002 TaxID=1385512 RepID=A0A0A5HZ50_9BACI|nr:PstS family phosphate ABC transporter substrate-binding protein [Pontibacillus litoralis]KGX88887.1 phosphate-binding protein [Pontibacillus litoralis JSM 072002]